MADPIDSGTPAAPPPSFELPNPLPDDLAALDALLAEAQAAFDQVYPGPDVDTVPSQETIDAMQALAEAITQINEKSDEVREAEAERITVAEELAAQVRGTQPDDDTEGDEFTAEQAPAGDGQDEPAAVVAAAQKRARRSFAGVAKASGRRPADIAPKRRIGGYVMDPGVPGYVAGDATSLDIAKALCRINTGARMRGSANASGAYTLATLPRDVPDTLLASNDQQLADAIELATDETKLDGGSLTAAGGWCSPSEIVWDFLGTNEAADLLDLPEVGIARGGLRFPVEPEFSAIYDAFPGFDYTEAQLIAGEANPAFEKPCVEIPCGDHQEVRLDAVGLCITNGILSAKAWPERTKKYVDEIMKAHQHRMSARAIGKIVAGSTAIPVPSANLLGASAAFLNVLEMGAEDIRTRHRIPSTATVEGFTTTWAKPVIRACLAYQQGVDVKDVTDAQIESWLTTRRIKLQYVSDWQTSAAGLPGAAAPITGWPTTIKVALYPAGTWFRAVEPVIELNALYDKAQLQKNKFTELFTEDGMAVFRRATDSRVYTIPVTVAGHVGLRVPLGGPVTTP